MTDQIRDVTKVIEEAAQQREAANARRRETRATARRDFADARKVGLRARHASRLREASNTIQGASMKVSDKTIHETIEATDIVEVIAADVDYMGTSGHGDVWEGVCPFCPAEDATLHVSKGRQAFNCSACGALGNAIAYVQLRDKGTFAEAVATLRGQQ